jgi:hypothetical protein
LPCLLALTAIPVQEQNNTADQSTRHQDTQRYLAYVAQFQALMAQRSQAAQPAVKAEVKVEETAKAGAVGAVLVGSRGDIGAGAGENGMLVAGKRNREAPEGLDVSGEPSKKAKLEDSGVAAFELTCLVGRLFLVKFLIMRDVVHLSTY